MKQALICCVSCLFFLYPGTLKAQSLSAAEHAAAPVAKHAKQDSKVKLPTDDTVSIAMAYTIKGMKIPPGAGTYDVKPDCSKPDVRRQPVYYDTDELKFFDLLYYNYHSSAQTRQADLWEGPTVPYLEGHLSNPARDHKNLQQEFGRFFDIRCLPTRVHYVFVDGVRWEEYREGERAWDPDPK